MTAVFSARGRVRLVTATVRGHGNLAAYPRARKIGRGLYRANSRSTRLLGVRRGRLRFIAAADRRLLRARQRPALRRYFAYAGLLG